MKKLFIFILGTVSLFAQTPVTQTNYQVVYKFVGVLASIPATCAVGELSFITNATAGQQIYECSATNTWTQQLNSGAGSLTTTGSPAIHQLSVFSAAATVTGIPVGTTDKPVVGVTGGDPTFSKVTITNPATAATLTIVDNKTFTVNKTMTLDGTDSQTYTFPSTSATIARTDAANTFTGHQTIEGVTSTGATGTNLLVFATSPVLTTPNLGTPSALTLTNATGLPFTSVTNRDSITTNTSTTGITQNGYLANNASLVTVAAPATCSVGDYFAVTGMGAGGWKISQAASQQIHFGNLNTTAGTSGYISSNNRYDAISMLCSVANLEWIVTSSIGNLNVN